LYHLFVLSLPYDVSGASRCFIVTKHYNITSYKCQ
jgi:hypothetical protein